MKTKLITFVAAILFVGNIMATVLLSTNFTSGQGKWTIHNVKLSGLDYIWKQNRTYGMTASGYYNQTNNETESWLISPVIDLGNMSTASMTFSQAVNYASPSGLLFVMASADGSNWSELQVSNWPAGNSWTYINSEASLNAFVGESSVQIAFVYTSSSTATATWEIKTVTVTGEPNNNKHILIGDLYYNLNYDEKVAEVTWEYECYENNYSELTTADIPDSVTYGKNAYRITSIREGAFCGCSSLTTVTIPKNVTSIGDYAFNGCSNLTSIIWNAKNGPTYKFGNQVTSFTFGDGVETIPESLCYGMNKLSSIEIPNSVTSIGENAFFLCSSLTSVTISNSVTSIGEGAFYGCSSITSPVYNAHVFAYMPTSYSGTYTIPDGIESIAGKAFYSCSNLTSIGIPNSVTSIGNSAFFYCSGLTSVTIPNSVTSIGQSAFYGCSGLTSIDIPNSVTSIGEKAFSVCRSLNSITIGNSVKSIGLCAFYGCSSLISVVWNAKNCENFASNNTPFYHQISSDSYNFDIRKQIKSFTLGDEVEHIPDYLCSGLINLISVTIPNSVTSIGSHAFSACSKLTTVTIPNRVTSIGERAFYSCSNLTSANVEPINPPTGSDIFAKCSALNEIHVPCESYEAYTTSDNWSTYSSIMNLPLYTISAKECVDGSVSIPSNLTSCDTIVQITAQPDYGYQFAQWADGNKDNPRVVELTQDTAFAAEFMIAKYGTCGDDNALTWMFDDNSKILSITGNGDLTENYTFGIEAPTQMNTLIIGDEITAIGDSAFYNTKTLNHLFIGGSVESIGNYAFAECRNFDDITCYATIVPTINATTFMNVGNKQYIYLYVPSDRERAYKRDTYWGAFDVQIKSAEATTTSEEVIVVPTDNTAEISWPTINEADTYEIEITKDGEVFCVLKFNANGQLTGIAFAPGRDGANYTQQAQTTGFKFTVTGLTSGTQYGYTIAAKNANDQTIDTKSGSFTTTGGIATAIDNASVDTKPVKLLRNGQLIILRDGKTYTVQGQEVR